MKYYIKKKGKYRLYFTKNNVLIARENIKKKRFFWKLTTGIFKTEDSMKQHEIIKLFTLLPKSDLENGAYASNFTEAEIAYIYLKHGITVKQGKYNESKS